MVVVGRVNSGRNVGEAMGSLVGVSGFGVALPGGGVRLGSRVKMSVGGGKTAADWVGVLSCSVGGLFKSKAAATMLSRIRAATPAMAQRGRRRLVAGGDGAAAGKGVWIRAGSGGKMATGFTPRVGVLVRARVGSFEG